MRPLVIVVLPTVKGREAKLDATLAAYHLAARFADVELATSVLKGRATCGEAWTEAADSWCDVAHSYWRTQRMLNRTGLGRRFGERSYLHFGADDLVPDEGALAAAIEQCERGPSDSWYEPVLPAPLVRRPDGSVESGGQWLVDLGDGAESTACMVPFMPLAAWRCVGPIPPIHYHSDNYFSASASACGFRFVVRHAYAFTHHLDLKDAGRISPGNARDSELYAQALAELAERHARDT